MQPIRVTIVALTLAIGVNAIQAQPSSFTYQGRLTELGVAVNDSADLRITLWDAEVGGSSVGVEQQFDDVPVVDGSLSLELDFGASSFGQGPRWLQVAVRTPHDPTDTALFTMLAPRQAVTAVPHALQTRGIFVNEAGNRVGIGTTAPGTAITNSRLDVIGGHIAVGNNFGVFSIDSDGSGIDAGFDTSTDGEMSFFSNGVSRMTIQRDGHVVMRGGADLRGLTDLIGSGVLRLAGDADGGTDLAFSAQGQIGQRTVYGNVTFNVQGRFPESQLLNVELSSGADIFQVQADGDVIVGGDLSVSGSKNFVTDHPLDPANKELVHNAVEGPDRFTLYRGNAVLDARGEAWVELPDYFEALNADPAYNLTCVGGHAPVYIADEVRDNRFRIAGGTPGLKVSWQVSGLRDDAYARANPYQDVVPKVGEMAGRYYHPAAYGMPEEMAISMAPQPALPTTEHNNQDTQTRADAASVGQD